MTTHHHMRHFRTRVFAQIAQQLVDLAPREAQGDLTLSLRALLDAEVWAIRCGIGDHLCLANQQPKPTSQHLDVVGGRQVPPNSPYSRARAAVISRPSWRRKHDIFSGVETYQCDNCHEMWGDGEPVACTCGPRAA